MPPLGIASRRISAVALLLAIAVASPVSGKAVEGREGSALRSFTVKDAIERSTLGGFGDRLQPSPDGRAFAFITSKGELGRGLVRSTVWIVRKDEGGQFRATAGAERTSTTNDEPISSLRWVDDGRGVAFLSPDDTGFPQVFRYDLATGESRQVTRVQQKIVSFDLRGDDCLFYAVARGAREFSAPGGYLGGESLLGLLMPEQDSLNEEGAAYVQQTGGPAKRLTALKKSLAYPFVRFAIAPDGGRAIAMLPASPDSGFAAAWKARPGTRPLVEAMQSIAVQPYLVDIASVSARPLLSAPTGIAIGDTSASQLLWAADGRQVALTNALLGSQDVKEGEELPSDPRTVIIDIGAAGSDQVSVVDQRGEPGERAAKLSWGGSGELVVESAAGAGSGQGLYSFASKGRRWRTTFGRGEGKWVPTGRAEIGPATWLRRDDVDFFVREDANTPPQIIGQDAGSGKPSFEFDLNPQLKTIRLNAIKEVKWTDATGHGWSGGLILPATRKAGERIPLVIELKFFDPTRFSPDGPYTTAFASQALAAKGMAVLELNAFDPATMDTAKEGPTQMRGIESAIDFLASQYGIDPDRVGLIGFSRTCYHVAYALTHSTRRFAAATIADGLSGGYVQYHAYSLNHTAFNGIKPLYDGLNGGPPWGETLDNWIKNSPDMNASRISTPLRIEMLGKSSVLQEWEIYSALKLQNKPVDALYLPDATHVLVKPRERYLSQQGNVNWFGYWLLGQEARDADNDRDYQRWDRLNTVESGTAAPTSK